MEKLIILALATECKRFSASVSKLVENCAELLASQGLLKTAMQYLLVSTINAAESYCIVHWRWF